MRGIRGQLGGAHLVGADAQFDARIGGHPAIEVALLRGAVAVLAGGGDAHGGQLPKRPVQILEGVGLGDIP
ncbi:Uncharacterised protein [Mycobacteroides abscessus subsp. massiliense]|nr:Uncharacterised protein [Mycobacteroides abscessus subsp. massiliense]